ncbi:MAG: insulinase family protein [Pelosinus sp.]|nr:insulinase family protein [Pelosinus sp.]
MDWTIGNLYHGFRLQEETRLKDIQSMARLFYHEKSGAQLLFLENKDDNKVFSITFRTPPANSTGVPHIIEHSVLCGSRKFPLREPFVELVKGSLNTYLNAMTFPDKTMYPVASRNQKDFRNLMDVYLDAVFYPNIYDSPETLMQEGWHYELEDKDGDITYKGVVYNEMKGALSSPDAILENRVFAALYPDTTYSFESGGDPEFIPELTQEKFLAFHKEYYHPANSYIFLYGDMDILDNLAFLDEAYLSHFEKIAVNSEIVRQSRFEKPVEKLFPYSVGRSEDLEDKCFMSRSFVIEENNAELSLAFEILTYLLLETPAAPLKKALLDAELGKDVRGSFMGDVVQPCFEIVVSGTNKDKKEKFTLAVDEELKRLVAEGIDKKLIEATINLFEFTLREANFGSRPKGLAYNIKCMESWLYGDSPLIHLEYSAALEKIKTALTTNYFEELIEKYLLNNTHQALVVLFPQPGLAEEKDEAVRTQLQQYKASLSKEELDDLVKEAAALKLRQQTPDSVEALESIPLLNLSDIEKQAEVLPLLEKQEQDTLVLYHQHETNDISYINLYFDTSAVPQADLPYVHLLAELLGKLSTSEYDYTELANEINLHTGGISYAVTVFTEKDTVEKFYPKFIVKSKALTGKLAQLFKLLQQIMLHSRFDQDKRMQELLQEIKAKWDVSLFRRGQELAVGRALSYFSPSAAYSEAGLLSFYDFIADLEKNYAAKASEIKEQLGKVIAQIFTKQNLLVSVTAEEQGYKGFQAGFQNLCAELPSAKLKPAAYSYTPQQRNEGLMTAGKVQYVVKAADFNQLGYHYHGSLKVLETILSYDYLWTRVRVQGGAYGAAARFERNGSAVFSSYRDPNLKETLTVYDETAAYLREFAVDEREMTKYIIGTMSRLDTPLTAAQQGEQATLRYIKNIAAAETQKERDEVLATCQKDIKALASLVEKVMQQDCLCVFGSEQKITANKDVFKETKHVLK